MANEFVVRSESSEEEKGEKVESGKNVGSCNARLLSVCRSPAVGLSISPLTTRSAELMAVPLRNRRADMKPTKTSRSHHEYRTASMENTEHEMSDKTTICWKSPC